ncbi:MAG: trigger factor [Candidatus Parcubacteria bacterium]|nr:trigger factor [Candidatus Parcubacteria bacterium]
MQYTYTTKKLPKSQLEINVTVLHDELAPFLKKAAEEISQQTKIEGFRPGKVPYEVLKQRIGEVKIYEEAAMMAVEKSYIEIGTKEKFEPLGSPKIDLEKLAPGNDLIYKATVDLIPEVRVGDFKAIKIKEKLINITKEQIDKVVDEVREMRATEVLDKKAVEMGDKVELDFEVLRDKVPIDGGSQKKYPLVIGTGQFIPGFEENLVGLKTEEEKEFELTFPEKYHNKNLAGKPATFKVKILAVYKRTLPEANDDFAKSLGQDTMDKLKASIEHNLEHEEHHKEEERIEIEMLEKIIDKSTFEEIPDVLVTAETNKMIQEMEANILREGMKFEDYLKHLGKTRDQLKLDFVPQAIKRVKSALLIRSIFLSEKMEIPEHEVDVELESLTHAYQTYPEMIKNIQTPQYREYVRNMVGNHKVMNLLKAACIERTNPEHKC